VLGNFATGSQAIHSEFIAGVYHRGREPMEMKRTPKEEQG
jgi:hypothetical protein